MKEGRMPQSLINQVSVSNIKTITYEVRSHGLSQSLLHQVSVSNQIEYLFSTEKWGELKSQSLLHQVCFLASNTLLVSRRTRQVAIPSSSGLCFQLIAKDQPLKWHDVEMSQSLLHQVSVSHIRMATFTETIDDLYITSQSLIHQVSVKHGKNYFVSSNLIFIQPRGYFISTKFLDVPQIPFLPGGFGFL